MRLRYLGLTVGVWAIATAASAQVWPTPSGTLGFTPIEGEITEVQSVRVPLGDTVTGVATQVTLNFTLQGCLDSLMPLISQADIDGDRATLYITALNAHHEASQRARCVAIPQATAQVSLPGTFQADQLEVVFMGVGQR